ncbi:MAG: hypothetical protein LBF97_03855 [Elusimicrobiota bacterium]|jgi:hypothetical protein|nr:hypothetical protein [Elusimicrobiota bacterium]
MKFNDVIMLESTLTDVVNNILREIIKIHYEENKWINISKIFRRYLRINKEKVKEPLVARAIALTPEIKIIFTNYKFSNDFGITIFKPLQGIEIKIFVDLIKEKSENNKLKFREMLNDTLREEIKHSIDYIRNLGGSNKFSKNKEIKLMANNLDDIKYLSNNNEIETRVEKFMKTLKTSPKIIFAIKNFRDFLSFVHPDTEGVLEIYDLGKKHTTLNTFFSLLQRKYYTKIIRELNKNKVNVKTISFLTETIFSPHWSNTIMENLDKWLK